MVQKKNDQIRDQEHLGKMIAKDILHVFQNLTLIISSITFLLLYTNQHQPPTPPPFSYFILFNFCLVHASTPTRGSHVTIATLFTTRTRQPRLDSHNPRLCHELLLIFQQLLLKTGFVFQNRRLIFHRIQIFFLILLFF